MLYQHEREIALNDSEFLIRIRMGQDEVSQEASNSCFCNNQVDAQVCRDHLANLTELTEEYSKDAMLVPADVIEAVNKEIRARGEKKVAQQLRLLHSFMPIACIGSGGNVDRNERFSKESIVYAMGDTVPRRFRY